MERDLSGLLFPRSVAVVGASGTPGKIGHALFQNVASSFSGPVWAVNPKYRELLGRPCVPSVADLPQPVDLAVIVVPAEHVAGVVRQCGERGIGNVAVISGGFKESGEEGARRERELVELARRYRINLLGPNVLGLISTRVGLNATFAPRGALPGDIAFMSQSGAFCTSVLDWAWQERLGFSHFVSLGNKAVLTEVEFLSAFARDPQTRVIVAYLEGISDGAAFIRTAREVAREKPVVVLKAGRAEAGARAVSSHTGTMAGSDQAYEAAFRKCGVIRAQNVEELFDYAYSLAKQPLPRGRRVGIVTNAGGAGVMATDAVEWEGLEVARFSEATARRLAERMPKAANIYNPVDILADARADRYREAVELVCGDPGVDMVVALSAPAPILTYAELAGILADARERFGKPLSCSFMAGELGEEAEGILRGAGIPSFFDPARAARALRVLADYARVRSQPRDGPRPLPVDREAVRQVLAEARAEDRPQLGLEAMEILSAYGIPVARGGFAPTPEEAGELARGLGEQVVLKVVSPDIIHKSDAGGVRVGVPAGEVEEEAWRLLRRLRERFPGAHLKGLYVQELLPPGREVILGMARDPTFGPLIMFGLGGIHVEVLRDVAFAVAPLSPREAEGLVRGIRGYPILRGVRGEPGVDLPALVEAVERLSRLVADFPEIAELDINPIMCYPDRVVAVDLRFTVAMEEGT
ncbi:acetate--CoA ligase family protein [Candidatus Bipolaricaulota bacterium]|nr:acetate--CoA ligase family protein [Candidatus Bipolaricaulota bacterium]